MASSHARHAKHAKNKTIHRQFPYRFPNKLCINKSAPHNIFALAYKLSNCRIAFIRKSNDIRRNEREMKLKRKIVHTAICPSAAARYLRAVRAFHSLDRVHFYALCIRADMHDKRRGRTLRRRRLPFVFLSFFFRSLGMPGSLSTIHSMSILFGKKVRLPLRLAQFRRSACSTAGWRPTNAQAQCDPIGQFVRWLWLLNTRIKHCRRIVRRMNSALPHIWYSIWAKRRTKSLWAGRFSLSCKSSFVNKTNERGVICARLSAVSRRMHRAVCGIVDSCDWSRD